LKKPKNPCAKERAEIQTKDIKNLFNEITAKKKKPSQF
jgi:hypothetical protein